MTINAYIATPFGGAPFSDANVNATISLANTTTLTTLILNPSQTSPGNYVTNYTITSTNQVDWRITVTALIDDRYLEFASVTVHINPSA